MIVDSFELAITTYALHIVNSPEKDNAFHMLHERHRTSTNDIFLYSKLFITFVLKILMVCIGQMLIYHQIELDMEL